MPPAARSQVNDAIERALKDGEAAYEERGILVMKLLESTSRLDTHDPVLEEALYTVFRALPYRLARGATLAISTFDRAGGDVELVWEAREMPLADEQPHVLPLARGPYADLLEVAIAGLEDLCRVRTAHATELIRDEARSSAVLQLAPHVRRRYAFLIPTLARLRSPGN